MVRRLQLAVRTLLTNDPVAQRLGLQHAHELLRLQGRELGRGEHSTLRLSRRRVREVSASLRSPVALGKDPRYVMAQLGHTDPTVTLGIYAQAMTSSDNDRERLRLLVEGRAKEGGATA